MKIQFIPSSIETERVVPPPNPSHNYIPQWYRDKKKRDGKSIFEAAKNGDMGLKSCVPFLDAMTSGYIQETWCDIIIERDDNLGYATYHYSFGPEILGIRDNVSINLDTNIYMPNEFVWKVQWIPKLPKGWSLLVTSPFNNHTLPFEVASGIIDSDNFFHVPSGSLPFYVKKQKDGKLFIPAGTPMYQLTPIKREVWQSEVMKFDEDTTIKNSHQIQKKFSGSYRNRFWQKKEYK